jgi:hypothetical protein
MKTFTRKVRLATGIISETSPLIEENKDQFDEFERQINSNPLVVDPNIEMILEYTGGISATHSGGKLIYG